MVLRYKVEGQGEEYLTSVQDWKIVASDRLIRVRTRAGQGLYTHLVPVQRLEYFKTYKEGYFDESDLD